MRFPTLKILAGTLASLLLFEAGVTPLAEASIWEDRQANRYAALPTPVASPLSLPTLPPLTKGLNDAVRISLPSDLTPILGVISLNSATIKDVYLNSKKGPFAVLIQDVHMNLEAQKNIADILLSVQSVGPITVGLEGLFGATTYNRFQAFEDKKLLRTLGDYFLKENKIPAAAFAAALMENPKNTFVGVDDEASYWANVDSYRASQKIKKAVVAKLEKDRLQLSQEKSKELNASLAKFDAAHTQYEKGEMGLGDYISFLAKNEEERDFVIEQFLAAYQIEKSLNFSLVEHERTRVMEKLVGKLSEAEMQDLMNQSLAYRAGRIGFGTFYQAIKRQIQSHDISLAATPAFDKYIQYVMLVEGLSAEKLITAVKRLEQKNLARLATTSREKELMAQSHRLNLTAKLVEFSLTPEEWKDYQEFTKNQDPRANSSLKSFEKFYEEADVRSEKMVANLLSGAKSQKSLVLITGGFHTPYLSALLKKRGVSYAVVQPKITKVDGVSGAEYLSVFTQQKSRLDELFEGEKLFLTPDMRPGTALFQGSADVYSQITGAHVRPNILPNRATRNDDGTYSVPLTSGESLVVSVEGKSNVKGMRVAPQGLPVTLWGRAGRSFFARLKNFFSGLLDLYDRLQWPFQFPIRFDVLVTPDGTQESNVSFQSLFARPLFSVTTDPTGGGSNEKEDVTFSTAEGQVTIQVLPQIKRFLTLMLDGMKGTNRDIQFEDLLVASRQPLDSLASNVFVGREDMILVVMEKFTTLNKDDQRLVSEELIRFFSNALQFNVPPSALRDEIDGRDQLSGDELLDLSTFFILFLLDLQNKNVEAKDFTVDLIGQFVMPLSSAQSNAKTGNITEELQGRFFSLPKSQLKWNALKLLSEAEWSTYRNQGRGAEKRAWEKPNKEIPEELKGQGFVEDDPMVMASNISQTKKAIDWKKGSSNRKNAWFQPLAFVKMMLSMEMHKSVRVIFFGPAVRFKTKANKSLPNSLSFQIDFVKAMVEEGYKKVVFNGSSTHLIKIFNWCLKQDKNVHLMSVVSLINEFVNRKGGRDTTLANFLNFPNQDSMPDDVAAAFKFWDEISDLRFSDGVEFIVLDGNADNQTEEREVQRAKRFTEWLKNEKVVVFKPSYTNIPEYLEEDSFLSFEQELVQDTYPDRLFFVTKAIAYLVNTIEGQGIPPHKTNGVPLAGAELQRVMRGASRSMKRLYEEKLRHNTFLLFVTDDKEDDDDRADVAPRVPTNVSVSPRDPVLTLLATRQTRETMVERMKRWGWIPFDAESSQRFSRPIELVIGIYAAVREAFFVFTPIKFYRAHDSPRWYQAVGIAAILAASIYMFWISFDWFTFDDYSSENVLYSLFSSTLFGLFGNIFAHGTYNTAAVLLGLKTLTVQQANQNTPVTIRTLMAGTGRFEENDFGLLPVVLSVKLGVNKDKVLKFLIEHTDEGPVVSIMDNAGLPIRGLAARQLLSERAFIVVKDNRVGRGFRLLKENEPTQVLVNYPDFDKELSFVPSVGMRDGRVVIGFDTRSSDRIEVTPYTIYKNELGEIIIEDRGAYKEIPLLTAKSGGLIIPATRERALQWLYRTGFSVGWLARNPLITRFLIGWYAAVVEVFRVFNPFGFYRAHDNPHWYQAVGIVAIWMSMIALPAWLLWGIDLKQVPIIVNTLKAVSYLVSSSIAANVLTHGLYNTFAVIFRFAPLTLRAIPAASATVAARRHPDRNEDSRFVENVNGITIAGIFDGMGGLAAGDKASQLVRDFVLAGMRNIAENYRPKESATSQSLTGQLSKLLKDADRKLKEDLANYDSGTTATVAFLVPQRDGSQRVFIAGGADSRAYMQVKRKLQPLTVDNLDPFEQDRTIIMDVTDVNTRLNEGYLPKLARVRKRGEMGDKTQKHFAQRNLVWNALSVNGVFRPVLSVSVLPRGGRLILTSDGVHDNLVDRYDRDNEYTNTIEKIAALPGDSEFIANELVRRAREESEKEKNDDEIRPKDDDITAIVIGETWRGTEKKDVSGLLLEPGYAISGLVLDGQSLVTLNLPSDIVLQISKTGEGVLVTTNDQRSKLLRLGDTITVGRSNFSDIAYDDSKNFLGQHQIMIGLDSSGELSIRDLFAVNSTRVTIAAPADGWLLVNPREDMESEEGLSGSVLSAEVKAMNSVDIYAEASGLAGPRKKHSLADTILRMDRLRGAGTKNSLNPQRLGFIHDYLEVVNRKLKTDQATTVWIGLAIPFLNSLMDEAELLMSTETFADEEIPAFLKASANFSRTAEVATGGQIKTIRMAIPGDQSSRYIAIRQTVEGQLLTLAIETKSEGGKYESINLTEGTGPMLPGLAEESKLVLSGFSSISLDYRARKNQLFILLERPDGSHRRYGLSMDDVKLRLAPYDMVSQLTSRLPLPAIADGSSADALSTNYTVTQNLTMFQSPLFAAAYLKAVAAQSYSDRVEIHGLTNDAGRILILGDEDDWPSEWLDGVGNNRFHPFVLSVRKEGAEGPYVKFEKYFVSGLGEMFFKASFQSMNRVKKAQEEKQAQVLEKVLAGFTNGTAATVRKNVGKLLSPQFMQQLMESSPLSATGRIFGLINAKGEIVFFLNADSLGNEDVQRLTAQDGVYQFGLVVSLIPGEGTDYQLFRPEGVEIPEAAFAPFSKAVDAVNQILEEVASNEPSVDESLSLQYQWGTKRSSHNLPARLRVGANTVFLITQDKTGAFLGLISGNKDAVTGLNEPLLITSDGITIGRADGNMVRINGDMQVSNKHAIIRLNAAGKVEIVDESTNGSQPESFRLVEKSADLAMDTKKDVPASSVDAAGFRQVRVESIGEQNRTLQLPLDIRLDGDVVLALREGPGHALLSLLSDPMKKVSHGLKQPREIKNSGIPIGSDEGLAVHIDGIAAYHLRVSRDDATSATVIQIFNQEDIRIESPQDQVLVRVDNDDAQVSRIAMPAVVSVLVGGKLVQFTIGRENGLPAFGLRQNTGVPLRGLDEPKEIPSKGLVVKKPASGGSAIKSNEIIIDDSASRVPYLEIGLNESGQVVFDVDGRDVSEARVSVESEAKEGQHASKFGWWMQATVFWLIFGFSIWMVSVNPYRPNGVWWAEAVIISVVLAVFTTVVASALPRGLIAFTRDGKTTYYKDVVSKLGRTLQSVVIAEEAWHARTTRWFGGAMRNRAFGWFVRGVDEFLAKIFALVIGSTRQNKFLYDPNLATDLIEPQGPITAPAADVTLTGFNRDGSIRAEVAGQRVRIVWVRSGKLIQTIVLGRRDISRVSIEGSGKADSLKFTYSDGFEGAMNLRYARELDSQENANNAISFPAESYFVSWKKGANFVTVLDKTVGNGNEAFVSFDLSNGFVSQDGFLIALDNETLAFAMSESVTVAKFGEVNIRRHNEFRSIEAIWFDERQRLIISTHDMDYSLNVQTDQVEMEGKAKRPEPKGTELSRPFALVPTANAGKPIRKPYFRNDPSQPTAAPVDAVKAAVPTPASAAIQHVIDFHPDLKLNMGFSSSAIEWVSSEDRKRVVGRYQPANQKILHAMFARPHHVLVYLNDKQELVFLSLEDPNRPTVTKTIKLDVPAIRFILEPTGAIRVFYNDETGKFKTKKINSAGFYGFAPILFSPDFDYTDMFWILGALFVFATGIFLFFFWRSVWVRWHIYLFKWQYRGGLKYSEIKMLERVRRNKWWKADDLAPVQKYNLNSRYMNRNELLIYSREVANKTRDPFDLALHAALSEKLNVTEYKLDPNQPWPAAHQKNIQVRIRMVDLNSTIVDTDHILDGLGNYDVAIVFANEKAQFTRPDSRIVRLSYSAKDMSAKNIERILDRRDAKNLMRAQVRIEKLVVKQKGVPKFLRDLEQLLGAERLDMFLLLPLNEQINVMIPLNINDIERMIDFEHTLRKVIDSQA